jgi:hypothetical protein
MVCDKCAGSEVFSPTAPAWKHSEVLRYSVKHAQVLRYCKHTQLLWYYQVFSATAAGTLSGTFRFLRAVTGA